MSDSMPPPDSEGTPLYECAATDLLTQDELTALGMVAAEWGLLEMSLEWHGRMVFSLWGDIGLAYLTGGAGGRRYAQILADAVRVRFRDKPDEVTAAVSELSRVDALATERNDLLHAAWTNMMVVAGRFPPMPIGDASRGGAAWGYMYKQRGRERKEFTYSAAQIMAVAQRISSARIGINHAMRVFLPV